MPNIGKSNKSNSRKIHKVIFIDRDGVINHDPIGDYIKNWKEFHFLPGVLSALKKLDSTRYQIVIISNQAGIGDGVYSKKSLDEITRKMLVQMKKRQIHIRGIYYCLHGKKAGCQCRKPETGLFRKASRNLHYKRQETFYIGDKATDMLAGKRFGLKTAFVLTGHGRKDFKKLTRESKPNFVANHLLEAVHIILNWTPKK